MAHSMPVEQEPPTSSAKGRCIHLKALQHLVEMGSELPLDRLQHSWFRPLNEWQLSLDRP